MKLKIEFIKGIEKNKDEILVNFSKEKLRIFENSDDWNSEKINNFLIKLATSIPENQEIELEYDKEKYKENENLIFNHIVDMFSIFAKEFNDSIKESLKKENE